MVYRPIFSHFAAKMLNFRFKYLTLWNFYENSVIIYYKMKHRRLLKWAKKEMRMSRLVEIINSRGYIPIKEIAQLLHVSEMTVRRDLAAVEKSGLVKNVNGVLVSNSGNTVQVLDKEYDLLNETQVQNEVKKLIGRFAATMIVPGDCVIF